MLSDAAKWVQAHYELTDGQVENLVEGVYAELADEVERLQAALAEIAALATEDSECANPDERWPLDGYNAQDAYYEGMVHGLFLAATIAKKAAEAEGGRDGL